MLKGCCKEGQGPFIREDPYSLQYVPNQFVTQEQIKIWHDDDDCYDNDKLIEWHEGYQKCQIQKAKIKEEILPIAWYPSVDASTGIHWCVPEYEKIGIENLWAGAFLCLQGINVFLFFLITPFNDASQSCSLYKMVLQNTKPLANTPFEYTRGEVERDIFMEKVLEVFKVYKVKCLKKPKLDVPAKNTEYSLFSTNMRETKEELKGVTALKASTIISNEQKKIKDSGMVKKYKDLHEIEKQQYEKNLQKYQKDHADEVEIINLHNVSFS